MTYCVGMCLREGVVLLADTRTNAGVDNIATFSKLHMFEAPGERVIGLMTAGNLAITQSVVTLLTEGLYNADTGASDTLMNVGSMFDAAQLVGRAVRFIYGRDGHNYMQGGPIFDVTFILAGQLQGRRQRMFQIYSAGNFIESSIDTPFMQLGETKYGKPILDRVCTYETPLWDAVKLGLISMDSTLRSNLSVGLPIDLTVIRFNEIKSELRHRIGEDDPYFHSIRERWSSALRDAYRMLPSPPWQEQQTTIPFPNAKSGN